MIVDEWRCQGVYRSTDATETWQRQPGENLLARDGAGPDDTGIGAHADVVVDADDRAWIFYFTHPELPVDGSPPAPDANLRRSTLHVTELVLAPYGRAICDRDAPAGIKLHPPV